MNRAAVRVYAALFAFCAFWVWLPACKQQTGPLGEHLVSSAMQAADGSCDAVASDVGKAVSAITIAATPAAILEDLVAFVTQRSRFPLALEHAEEQLRPWGPLKRDVPFPDLEPVMLILSGERTPVLRFQVTYHRDEKGAWKFQSAGFNVTDPSGIAAPTYKRLFTMIRTRLGKPAWKEPQQGRLTAVGWKLRHRIELVLSEEVGSPPTGGPSTDYVSISISEPEGEPD